MSLGYSNRLARGRTYARAGRTHDLVIKAGEVTAKVTGSRATPYKVRIALTKLPDRMWAKATTAMAGKAQFAADLLTGQMPQDIDAAFKEAGVSLFPAKESDLQTSCSCPDWANPCKHVAAIHYVLGEAFDRDPFLLFELRGRSKDQVLAALRAVRADARGGAPAARARSREDGAPDAEHVPSVSLRKLAVADYDKPRAPLPALHLSFEATPMSGAILMQLGTPPAWSSDASPVELLAPILHGAAEAARRLALAERDVTDLVDPPADENAKTRARAKPVVKRTKAASATATKTATAKWGPAGKAKAGMAETAALSKARRNKA
jgi:uncharacterized Zn finger protein